MRITLAVTAGPHKGREFSFVGHDSFIVGRAKAAHFRLPLKDRYFSRLHFMVEVNLPQCRLVDMGSRNGTFVNGKRVTKADLKDGDKIKAGRTALRVAIEASEAIPNAVPASTPPPQPANPADPPRAAEFVAGAPRRAANKEVAVAAILAVPAQAPPKPTVDAVPRYDTLAPSRAARAAGASAGNRSAPLPRLRRTNDGAGASLREMSADEPQTDSTH